MKIVRSQRSEHESLGHPHWFYLNESSAAEVIASGHNTHRNIPEVGVIKPLDWAIGETTRIFRAMDTPRW